MDREQLIDARKRLGLTQRQLAEALGLHHMTIVKWERDQRRMPGRWLDLALAQLACSAGGHTPIDRG